MSQWKALIFFFFFSSFRSGTFVYLPHGGQPRSPHGRAPPHLELLFRGALQIHIFFPADPLCLSFHLYLVLISVSASNIFYHPFTTPVCSKLLRFRACAPKGIFDSPSLVLTRKRWDLSQRDSCLLRFPVFPHPRAKQILLHEVAPS